MYDIENYPQGYWRVGDKKFLNKFESLLESKEKKLVVDYVYFDHIWENFDRSKLGQKQLKELYLERALQLRQKYDYLILYFSGGADSYNVLRTFLDNDIFLDEICVKWCESVFNSNTTIYKPNTNNQTAYNYLSEWDYAIKPVLETVSQKFPKIKIQIVDWFKDRKLIGSEETFKKVNHWHDIEVTSLAVWSPSEKIMIEKGKTVGSIYGIDKPVVYFHQNHYYMVFSDAAITMGTPNDINVFGTEYFYYSPSFPELAFEMANVVAKKFQTDKKLQDYLISSDKRNNLSFLQEAHQFQQKYLRNILYDNWTDRFQTLKPIMPNRSDKHNWIYRIEELRPFRNNYEDMRKLHLNKLQGSMYLGYTTDKNIPSDYKPIYSKKHLIF
jgi:hypothetical protein